MPLCQGQVIGAFVANSKLEAQQAAKTVNVSYREKPAIFTIEVCSMLIFMSSCFLAVHVNFHSLARTKNRRRETRRTVTCPRLLRRSKAWVAVKRRHIYLHQSQTCISMRNRVAQHTHYLLQLAASEMITS